MSNTDGIFLKGNNNNRYNNNSTDGIFLQYNTKIYKCDEYSIKCNKCIGKDKCRNYRIKGCGF